MTAPVARLGRRACEGVSRACRVGESLWSVRRKGDKAGGRGAIEIYLL